MPRGTPDGRIVSGLYAAQETDLAAIYSMLWGFSPIDGRGRVVYLDTFNNGLNGWVASKTGAGVVPTVITPTSYVYSPPNCVSLNPGTTTNDQSLITREAFAGKSKRIGVEIGFSFNSGFQPYVTCDYNPVGLPARWGNIYFNQTNGTWSVRQAGGTRYTFYTPGVPVNTMLMQIKFVMDFETGYYVRAFIGDYDFDLSGIQLDTSSSTVDGLLGSSVINVSKGAGASAMQLGYFLLTKDEP